MSTLYECQECPDKKVLEGDEIKAHFIATRHTNIKKVVLGGEGQGSPTSQPMSSPTVSASQTAPPSLSKYRCPDCGRLMVWHPRIPGYLYCEAEDMPWTEDKVKERWEYQGGKPANEATDDGRRWFGIPRHLGARQKVGMVMMLVPAVIFLLFVYSILYLHWRWF
jgi:hypothetical protein